MTYNEVLTRLTADYWHRKRDWCGKDRLTGPYSKGCTFGKSYACPWRTKFIIRTLGTVMGFPWPGPWSLLSLGRLGYLDVLLPLALDWVVGGEDVVSALFSEGLLVVRHAVQVVTAYRKPSNTETWASINIQRKISYYEKVMLKVKLTCLSSNTVRHD